jgi:hypothetical protein
MGSPFIPVSFYHLEIAGSFFPNRLRLLREKRGWYYNEKCQLLKSPGPPLLNSEDRMGQSDQAKKKA